MYITISTNIPADQTQLFDNSIKQLCKKHKQIYYFIESGKYKITLLQQSNKKFIEEAKHIIELLGEHEIIKIENETTLNLSAIPYIGKQQPISTDEKKSTTSESQLSLNKTLSLRLKMIESRYEQYSKNLAKERKKEHEAMVNRRSQQSRLNNNGFYSEFPTTRFGFSSGSDTSHFTTSFGLTSNDFLRSSQSHSSDRIKRQNAEIMASYNFNDTDRIQRENDETTLDAELYFDKIHLDGAERVRGNETNLLLR